MLTVKIILCVLFFLLILVYAVFAMFWPCVCWDRLERFNRAKWKAAGELQAMIALYPDTPDEAYMARFLECFATYLAYWRISTEPWKAVGRSLSPVIWLAFWHVQAQPTTKEYALAMCDAKAVMKRVSSWSPDKGGTL